MNLIVRITLVFAAASLFVFLAGGFITFRAMEREVIVEQQRALRDRLEQIKGFIERRNPTDSVKWSQVLIVPLKDQVEERMIYGDTLVMHAYLQRMEPHVKLTSIVNINERSYYVSLFDLIIESDDIMDAVTDSMLSTYLILLIVVFPVGFGISYVMLRPFRDILHGIKKFSLQDKSSQFEMPNTGIPEFQRLNSFLSAMTDKVKHDYETLKEFSENASHELRTPVAIIQSKIEVLLDSPLNEEQVAQLIQIQYTLKRLSNLSNSLGLLTKIDNKEFVNKEVLNLSEILQYILDEFRELTELKGIKLSQEIKKDIMVRGDRTLFEILLTNLLNNAIRHNFEENGYITISLTEAYLTIENSGESLLLDPNELFLRFKKSNQSNQSTGLGLAIVKRICELYDLRVSYEQVDRKHVIRVGF